MDPLSAPEPAKEPITDEIDVQELGRLIDEAEEQIVHYLARDSQWTESWRR